MCDKAVDNCPHALKFISDSYMIQRMCDKAVNTYPSTIEYVPDLLKSQEMCDDAFNRFCLVFDSIPDWYKTQEMCDKTNDPFLIVYCLDKYKTQKRMCDDSLAALKLIPNWFVTSKTIDRLQTASNYYANENIIYIF